MKKVGTLNIKSIFIISMASYVFLIIITLAIGVFAYSKATEALEQEAFRANMGILEKARYLIDSEMNQVNQLTSQVSNNTRVASFMNQDPEIDSTVRYNLPIIIQELSNYKNMYPFIYDFYIYFHKSNTILTPDSKYSPEIFYNYIYKYDYIDFSRWKAEIIDGYRNKRFLYSQNMSMLHAVDKITTYTQSLPLYERHNPLASLVVFIDELRIRNLLSNLSLLNNGAMYIVDKNGYIIFSTGDHNSTISSVQNRFTNKEGWFYHDTEDHRLVVSYISSQSMDWNYVSVMPRDMFISKVTYVKKVRNFALLAIVILGLTLASIFAYRSYYPVKNIVKMISLRNMDYSCSGFNEYDYIEKNILAAWEKDKKIQEMLSEQKGIIKTNLLLRTLEGRKILSRAQMRQLEAFDVKFKYDNFFVILFSVKSTGDLLDQYTEEDLVIMELKATQFIQNVIKFTDVFYILITDNIELAVMLNCSIDNIDEYKEPIQNIVYLISQFYDSTYKLSCSTGVGSIYKGINNINKSYTEAERALQYKSPIDCSIVYYRDMVRVDERYYYPFEIQQQMIKYLATGDFKKVDRLVNYIFEENQVKRHLSLRMIKFLVMDLTNTVIKAIDELNVENKEVYGNGQSIIDWLADSDTFHEMHSRLSIVLRHICDYINNKKRSHNDWLYERVVSHIHDEYQNSEICLTSIAEKFNVTPQHLSRFFKEQSGETILDFLYKLRIDRAKKLLNDPSLSLDDVAKSVGYGESRALIRAFKKYVGTTPGSFRSNIQPSIVTTNFFDENTYHS